MLVALDRWWRGEVAYGALAATFVCCHLVLDFIDGSGVFALYPFVETGVGLTFPISVTFAEGISGIAFEWMPVTLAFDPAPVGFAESADVDRNTFGFLNPFGVALTLAFACVYLGLKYRERWNPGGMKR